MADMLTQLELAKAKELIAGRVEFDVLCRHAAHNKHERKQVENALKERISKPRKAYLINQLRKLGVEKSLLETKYARIKSKVVSEHQFII